MRTSQALTHLCGLAHGTPGPAAQHPAPGPRACTARHCTKQCEGRSSTRENDAGGDAVSARREADASVTPRAVLQRAFF